MDIRIGFAKDIHILKSLDRPKVIRLGLIDIDSNYEIIAHSDGDIIVHSIVDAILDALNLEDIGFYFSDKDNKNKNLDSSKMLEFAISKLEEHNFTIKQLSLTVITNHIYIQNIKINILNKLKQELNINLISLKGKRFEIDNNTIECYCNLLLETIK